MNIPSNQWLFDSARDIQFVPEKYAREPANSKTLNSSRALLLSCACVSGSWRPSASAIWWEMIYSCLELKVESSRLFSQIIIRDRTECAIHLLLPGVILALI
jgi:hypothetical protein